MIRLSVIETCAEPELLCQHSSALIEGERSSQNCDAAQKT